MSYYNQPDKTSFYGDSSSSSAAASNSSTAQQRHPSNTMSMGGYPAAASIPAYQASSRPNPPLQKPQQPLQQQPFGGQGFYSQQPVPIIFNPATAAVAMNAFSGNYDGLADIGQAFLKDSWAKWIPGFEASMLVLRNYFAVDNRYVLRKMQKVLFPFFFKEWQRQIKEQAGPETPIVYETPVTDENAPDLYLPSMSLITYVLLCALCYGTAGQFNPEVIPDVTYKCFLTQALEVLAIRMGFYLMQAPVALLDLFSYTGYKYLSLCVNLMIGLMASHAKVGMRGYYVCFCWTASAAAYFMMKTMNNNIPLQTAAAGPKREVVVLTVAAAQCASMWFVGQTQFL